jgi:hypothetical protein
VKKKDVNINPQVIKVVPFGDRYLPKDIDTRNPRKGRKIRSKYILIF